MQGKRSDFTNGQGKYAAKSLKVVFLAVLFVALGLAGAKAQEASWVTVTRKAGVVESNLSSSNTWLRITKDRKLGLKDRVRTRNDSAAQLQLSDNSLLAMGPNTKVTLSEFAFDNKKRTVKVDLKKGILRTQVAKFKSKKNRFQITSQNSVIAAQGTNFAVIVEKKSAENQDGSNNTDETSKNTVDNNAYLNADSNQETLDQDAQFAQENNLPLDSQDENIEDLPKEETVTKLAVYEGEVTMAKPGEEDKAVSVKEGNTAVIFGTSLPVLNPLEFTFNAAKNYVENLPGVRELLPLGNALRAPENVVDQVKDRITDKLRVPFSW